jgi:hypothetical protein
VTVSAQAQGIVRIYRGHVERFRGYQRMQGSNWTDAMVVRELAPHHQQAASRLYQLGLDQAQVAKLLEAAGRPPATSAQDSTAYMNALVRRQREGQQPAPSESMNEFIRRMAGR